VKIKTYHSIRNILQNTFYACYCIVLSGRPHTLNADSNLFAALLCYLGAAGAETSLHTALNSPHPIHAADMGIALVIVLA